MNKILIGAIGFAALVLTGCNEAERLASQVEGTWSSTPQMIVNDAGSQATMVETINFERDSAKTGGQVMIVGMVSCTGSMAGSDALVQPFEIAASAKSTVTGRWTAIDDDEIMLSLDVANMSVAIDPSGLVISSNVLTGSTQSDPEPVKPQVAAMVESALKRQLLARYTSMTKLDDVKVKDNGSVLKFEVGKTDYVYSSQNPSASLVK
ncbi:MAG: hypothetical protein K2L46_06425 [Paramuribaculum sp.]|nr:hypothetical protein [Paramuribaculum sp.]MDE6324317.1 hypothetical protein [Paramuribaculum sp.]MDE6488899.1 hypothetical protein [Paramuribaculum sp.]